MTMIPMILRRLWTDTQGQDLIEYTLLLAFVALGAIGLVMSAGQSLAGAHDEGSEILHSAYTAASGS